MRMSDSRGFSLIEIVVTVTVMAVLSVAGFVTYQGTNTKTRDEKRKTDLQKIASSLEMIYQDQGFYPETLTDEIQKYLPTVPTDPKNGYSYAYNSTVGSYELFAHMEDVGSTNGSYSVECIHQQQFSCNYRIKGR